MVTRERLTSHDMTCLCPSRFPNESKRESHWHSVLDRNRLEGTELLEKCIKRQVDCWIDGVAASYRVREE